MSSYREAMSRLRADLERAGYTADAVLAAIGDAGQLALTRNHTMAAERALQGRDDGLATLIRLFILQQGQPAGALGRTLDVAALAELGLLRTEGDEVRATVDVRPVADETDGLTGWVISDHAASLNTANQPPAPDHVLGVSPASISLAQITPRHRVGRALDLGTGSGIQSLHLARHADRVTATDVNSRALTLATLTFALNDVAVETRAGSLYEPVADTTFDLIATNPPFVIAPARGRRLVYRETEYSSDDLMRAVIAGAVPRLNPGGSLHVVGNWAHVADQPWSDRLAAWLPAGCAAFQVEREVLDPYEYIEVWLADAGLAGHPSYRQRYDEWLAYFDQLGITAVGMGWVTLVKDPDQPPAGPASAAVVCEHWPYGVRQPVADDLMAHIGALAYAQWTDAQMLAATWALAPGTVQETTGAPGDPDPAHVRLRRTDGLCRAIEVDPALGGILGACDGDLSLGRIIAAVADVLGVEPTDLRHEVLPRLRELIAQTWLTPRI